MSLENMAQSLPHPDSAPQTHSPLPEIGGGACGTGITAEWLNKCHFGDCLETLRRMPEGIVNTCVTSPPYFGLRDYGHEGQIGLEPTPDEFITKLVSVFREVRRVLRDNGTLWVNMGDTYCAPRGNTDKAPGHDGKAAHSTLNYKGTGPSGDVKVKDLIGIPWMLAFALRSDGWHLRQDIIWAKPNPMPESVTDRCTKSHEYIFLLSKRPMYYCDMSAIKEQVAESTVSRLAQDIDSQIGSDRVPGKTNGRMKAVGGANSFARKTATEGKPGSPPQHRADREPIDYEGMRNKRSVWNVATTPYKGAHFATFPTELIEPCILAGAPAGGVVLDPFFGSGTTGEVSQNLGRAFIGCELNLAYEPLQRERLRQPGLILEDAS